MNCDFIYVRMLNFSTAESRYHKKEKRQMKNWKKMHATYIISKVLFPKYIKSF